MANGPEMICVKCQRCGKPFDARVADRNRGWARFCSTECVRAPSVEYADANSALWMIQGASPEAQQAFMVNWLRGEIVIPEDVKLRIWLMENEKRGLKPIMEG